MRSKTKIKSVARVKSKRVKRTASSTAVKPKLRKSKVVQSSSPATWEAIYAAVERIPRGRVTTYGGIAQVAGLPRRARLVGTALKHVSRSRKVPWFRVLTASGRFAFAVGSDAYHKQQQHLQREGVYLSKGRIDLKQYGWPNDAQELDEMLWHMGD